MNRHVVVAVVSAVVGTIALALALTVTDDPVNLGTALGLVLLANAAVRVAMARD